VIASELFHTFAAAAAAAAAAVTVIAVQIFLDYPFLIKTQKAS